MLFNEMKQDRMQIFMGILFFRPWLLQKQTTYLCQLGSSSYLGCVQETQDKMSHVQILDSWENPTGSR